MINIFKRVEKTRLVQINDTNLKDRDISLYIKRDDEIHESISGNKLRKLKYNLIEAKSLKKKILLTFGGAYSNHIFAVAAAGKLYGFETIGIIRGEKTQKINKTLSFALNQGMHLDFTSRSVYRNKNDNNFLKQLKEKYNHPYIIPEGGTNTLAVKGCTEIIDEIDIPFDYICTAVGTGGTVAGLIAGCNHQHEVIGFSALKGGDFLKGDVANLLTIYNNETYHNWTINTDYHFGGYAKIKPKLIDFINVFKRKHGIQLEPIYTGKMMFGIYDLIERGYFERGSRIVALHTGGLQGIRGMNERYGNVIK